MAGEVFFLLTVFKKKAGTTEKYFHSLLPLLLLSDGSTAKKQNKKNSDVTLKDYSTTKGQPFLRILVPSLTIGINFEGLIVMGDTCGLGYMAFDHFKTWLV